MINNTEKITASQAIDPYAFKDPVSGKWYLFWGNGKALLAELNDDMISINEDTLVAISGLTNYNEGSSMAYRNGVYHYNCQCCLINFASSSFVVALLTCAHDNN